MHNLLSEENKKNIKQEYRARLFIVFLWFVFALGVIFFVSLIPLYIFSQSRERELLDQKKTIEHAVVTSENERLDALLKATKEKVDSLKMASGDFPLHVIIGKVLLYKNPGIKIKGFVFGSKNGKERELSLLGVASSREALVQFRKSMEQEKIFNKVTLPVSNFAKRSEIDFTLNLFIQPS